MTAQVVVLGAGLAGLTAAYTLMRSGCGVTLLEAQDRVGGRVLTARAPFYNGGYAELGAQKILDVHRFTNRYVHELGLADKLVELPDATTVWFVRGRRFVTPTSGEPWPLDDMSPEERRDPFAALERYLGPAFESVGDVSSPGWPNGWRGVRALDGLTLGDYARRSGASEGWLRFFVALEGDLLAINAAAAVASEAGNAGATAARALRGGNDQFPAAFAAVLGDRVRTRSPVTRIVNTSSGVAVGYRGPDARIHEQLADYCVCTIPYPVLARLELDGFASVKRDAIAQAEMAPAGKVFFQTRNRFWSNDPLGELGGLHPVRTDTPAGRICNTSEMQPGHEGMLHAYLFPPDALALEATPERDRAARIDAEVRRFLPGLRDEVVATCSKLWQEDPHHLGACAVAPPGKLTWLLDASRRPDGRVHFAGEHTVAHVGWMDGAIASGERAAGEILARVSR